MATGTIGGIRYTYDTALQSVGDDGFADLGLAARWFTGDPPEHRRLAAPMDLTVWLDTDRRVVHLPVVGDHLEHRGWQLRQVTPVVAACFDRLTLHASAVAVDGRVLAFVGGSGIGKSTLAWEAVKAGASAVSDDLLPIRLTDDVPRVPTADGPLDLALIGFLRRHDGDLAVTDLAGPEAFELHLRNGFGEHGDPEAWAFQFDAYHRLVAAVSHGDVAVPDDRARIGDVARALLDLAAHGEGD